jgi:TfoX/Sxy family transcriptional regulator of competence genes
VAYDEDLADRVRNLLATRAELTEKKMFGSLGFLVGGNLAVGVRQDELIVRLDPADAETALTEENVREFPPGRSPMKGWVLVAVDRSDEAALAEWVDAGADYAASLPTK